ncbi:MAG: helix-turn-helix transcriptional regulator [Clostridia bacterium]|nr:helix-turn-helix transcriptional regulator [Clostridia bacterium]
MNIGEKIYNLRREKKLSQGDLADLLQVSRQSVSKWENNTATPDLQKIIKLSEVFEVSLDDLVKGETAETEKVTEYIVKHERMPGRKIAGIILICLAFLISVLAFIPVGLIYASPLIVCAIICFICKSNVLLKCIWVVYIAVSLFLSFSTGISLWNIRAVFVWRDTMLSTQKTATVISFVVMLVMIGITVLVLSKNSCNNIALLKRNTILFWSFWGVSKILSFVNSKVMNAFIEKKLAENTGHIDDVVHFFNVPGALLNLAALVLFTAALTYTVKLIKNRKQ